MLALSLVGPDGSGGDALRSSHDAAAGGSAGSLTGRAARGAIWSGLAVAAAKLLSLGSTAVLARLLLREDFGIAGYALVVCGLIETAQGLGVPAALVYFPADPRRTSTAFWICLASGALFGLAVWLAAPLVAEFFRDPRAAAVTRLASLYFPITGAGLVSDALLRKELRFRHRFRPELARAVSKAAITIALAALGLGYWSLVLGQLAGAAVYTAGSWLVVRWRPHLSFDRSQAGKLLRYGRAIFATSIIGALQGRVDQMATGRLLGAPALGLYSVACRLPAVFVTEVTYTLARVQFPTYALLQSSPDRLRRAALRAVRLVAATLVPVALGLALVSRPLIVVGLGEDWSDAARLVPWLALAALTRALGSPFGEMFNAVGRPGVTAILNGAWVALLAGALALVGGGGLPRVAAAVGLMAVLRYAVLLLLAQRVLAVPVRRVLAAAAPAIGAGAIMALAVSGLDRLLGGLGELPRLLALTAGGAAVYGLALWRLAPDLPEEIDTLLRAARGLEQPRTAGPADAAFLG